jgi:hypothetical protein
MELAPTRGRYPVEVAFRSRRLSAGARWPITAQKIDEGQRTIQDEMSVVSFASARKNGSIAEFVGK